MSKALGAEINDFYNNHFPENHFMDESEDWIEEYITDKNGLDLPASEKFELADFGYIISEETDKSRTFSGAFKKWKRNQDSAYVVVKVANDKKAELIAYLQKGGYTAK